MTDVPGRPRTAVVILHWGDPDDTLAALASVVASREQPARLLVVDNGTRALRVDAVARAAPAAELVSLPENLGYAGGNNVGIRRALESGAERVVLLNNDAILDPDCLAALGRAADAAGARLGAVGAKVLSASDPSRLWMAYGRVTYRAALVERVGQGEADGPAYARAADVDWVSGCAILLGAAALADVGLLDERFFAYHEDVDWCTRARARGYRVVFEPVARVVHRGGGSLAGRGVASPVRYLSARNTILFARKHAHAADWARLALTIGASLPLEWMRLRRRGEGAALALLLRGYRDGLLNRPLPLTALGLR